MKQIFIAGTSRTGSKFYMQLLNSHRNIHISPELIFRHPVKKNFHDLIEKKTESVDQLAKALLEFKERGTYVKTIQNIGEECLKEELSKLKEINPYAVFNLIISLAAKNHNKEIYGTKFSLHYSYTNELASKFSNSKILFLTRDPRAIFISDFKKKKKESKGRNYRFPIKGFLLRIIMLLYVIREWVGSMNEYEKCLKSNTDQKIQLFFYEQILTNKERQLDLICTFLGFSPKEFDLDSVKVADSSYKSGISNDRWMNEIRKYEKLFFKIVIGRKMKKYGYR